MNRFFKTYLRHLVVFVACVLIACLAACFSTVGGQVGRALADDNMSLEDAMAQLENAKAEHERNMQSINEIKVDLAEKENAALQAQEVKKQTQDNVNKLAAYDYKTGLSVPYVSLVISSDSIHDFLQNIDYCNQIMKRNIKIVQAQSEAVAAYENSIGDLNDSISELNKKIRSSNDQVSSMQSLVSSINKKIEEQEAAEAAAAAQAQQEYERKTIVVPSAPDVIPVAGEWKSGRASAYGGFDDPHPGGTTSTGAAVTESSTGISFSVHMPNYSSYYGRTVQIRHNGKTVLGTVNDSGGFAYPDRVMDLQPGIYRGFGCSGCLDWGVRSIDYCIL